MPRVGQAAVPEGSAYAVAQHETPAELCPGETRRVVVRVENTGTRAWDRSAGDRLSYQWMGANGSLVIRDGRRTELADVVAVGEQVEVLAKVTAPAKAGEYRLVWRLLRENAGWFPLDDNAESTVRVRGEGAPLAWAVEEVGAMPEIAAKADATLRVKVRNTGCAPWSKHSHDRMSYRWFSANGRTKVADGKRTEFERDVASGDTTEVELTLAGPPSPGRFTLRLSPVRERVGWLGEPDAGEAAFAVEVRNAALQWSWRAVELPSSDLTAGDTFEVQVEVENTGTQPWDPELGDRLSYHWLHEGKRLAREGQRTLLPHVVKPGQRLTMTVKVAAPDRAGEYQLAIEPLREGVAWYGPPAHGEVTTPGPSVKVGPPAFAWSLLGYRAPHFPLAGHQTAFTVVLRNEGAQAWEPSDRVSYEVFEADGVTHVANGRRTDLDRRVLPGEVVRLQMGFDTPRSAGEYVVRFGVLRENVRWFGGEAEPVSLKVMRRSSIWVVAAMVPLFAFVLLRPRRGVQPWVDAMVWPAWTLGAVVLLTELVADLSHFQFFEQREWVALSVAGLPAVLVALLRPRAQPWVAFGLVVLLTVVALVDLSYAAFFGGLAPLTAVRAIHHLLDAEATVGSTLKPAFAWLLVPPLSVLLILLGDRHRTQTRHRRAARVVLATCLLGTLPAIVSLAQTMRGSLGTRVFSEAHNAQRFGYVGAHVFQALRLARELGAGPLSAKEREQVWAALAQVRTQAPREGHGIARGSNVVIIQVEALQSWVVHAQVEGQAVMPFLASAHREALEFSVYDQTAQGRTSDAEYLVLGSGHALPEGALSFLRADNAFRTLVHALADEGYDSYSAHPYQRGFWNRSVLHPAYGFARSDFRDVLGKSPSAGWGLADGPFLQRFGQELAQLREPFVAFAITLSLHHPYESFPARFSSLALGALEGSWEGNYVQAMRHFDESLEAWFEQLEASGLRENTVVVIYGDHVTGMTTGDRVARLADERRTRHVDARLHRVPVFVWAGDLHGRSDVVGGQIDIGATALHVLGVEPPMSFVGTPLLGDGPGFAALPNGGGATDDRMLIRDGPHVGPEGVCVALPSEQARPREECAPLEARVSAQLQLARRILDHDLYVEAEAQR